jgi:hypothetical protein
MIPRTHEEHSAIAESHWLYIKPEHVAVEHSNLTLPQCLFVAYSELIPCL